MTHQFKIGDKAYHVLYGVVKLMKINIEDWNYQSHEWDANGVIVLTGETGKGSVYQIHPEIITLEAARKMGYAVPEEKMRIELDVEWVQQRGGTVIPAAVEIDFKWKSFVGKKGKLTFQEE